MKTIKLTDDQFETLFHFVDERVEDIVDRSCLLYTSPSPRDS